MLSQTIVCLKIKLSIKIYINNFISPKSFIRRIRRILSRLQKSAGSYGSWGSGGRMTIPDPGSSGGSYIYLPDERNGIRGADDNSGTGSGGRMTIPDPAESKTDCRFQIPPCRVFNQPEPKTSPRRGFWFGDVCIFRKTPPVTTGIFPRMLHSRSPLPPRGRRGSRIEPMLPQSGIQTLSQKNKGEGEGKT